jgi:hypothetical protein
MDEYLNQISHDEYLFGVDLFVESAWIGHAPVLKYLIREVRPKNYVELGVHNGFSYFVACQSFLENKINGKTYAIDHWLGDGHVGLLTASVYEEVQTYNSNYANFSELMKMDFNSAANRFSESSIELLHIDGFHSYESVKEDFETWLPKIAKNGIVLLHDICVRRNDFGVYQFWDEIKTQYKTMEFVGSHGLGVIFLGEIQGHGLEKLYNFSITNNGMAKVQGTFGSISDDVIQKSKNEKINNLITERDAAITERDAAITERDAAITERDAAITERDAAITEREEIANSRIWRTFSVYRSLRIWISRI